MRFFISGEIDSELADTFRPVRQEVESQLNNLLGCRSYGPDIEKIALIPIILGATFSPRKERRLLQRKTKSADYRLAMDFDKFLHGSDQERKLLLINNLLDAITDITRKLDGKFDGKTLRNDILSVFPFAA